MKLKVTIEFESENDMMAYFANKAPTIAKQEEVKDVPAPKEKEVPKKEKAPKAEKVKEAPAPTVEEAPIAPSFDSETFLATVTKKVEELKGKGVTPTAIANVFMGIFSKMGVAGKKISELDNATMAVFASHFPPEIKALEDSIGPSAQPTSFI